MAKLSFTIFYIKHWRSKRHSHFPNAIHYFLKRSQIALKGHKLHFFKHY